MEKKTGGKYEDAGDYTHDDCPGPSSFVCPVFAGMELIFASAKPLIGEFFIVQFIDVCLIEHTVIFFSWQ